MLGAAARGVPPDQRPRFVFVVGIADDEDDPDTGSSAGTSSVVDMAAQGSIAAPSRSDRPTRCIAAGSPIRPFRPMNSSRSPVRLHVVAIGGDEGDPAPNGSDPPVADKQRRRLGVLLGAIGGAAGDRRSESWRSA